LRREIAKLCLLFEIECCIRRPCELRDPRLVPGIDVLLRQENVDGRDKCGHDGTRPEHSMRHLLRRTPQFTRQITPDNRIASDACRFRQSRQAAIVRPVPEQNCEKIVRQKAVTPGPHPRRKTYEACAQGFHQDAIFQDAIL
jgi:hypothetical protein